MPQIIELSPDHRVVVVTVNGPISDPESFALIGRGLELQRRSGIGGVLIDCQHMTHAMSYTEIIDMAAHVAGLDLPPAYRQSIVRPDDTYTAMSMDLWEAACCNRGLTVKVHPTREAALSWLVDTEPAP